MSEVDAGATLSRSLQARHVTMISIGGIIGAGLFVGSSAAIAAVGPAVILSYLAAGAVIFFVMRMLSEMAAAHPHVGSFTEYTRLAFGSWAGFVSGWLYWYFWVVVVAIEAIAGAGILALWIPVPPWQIGFALMVLLTAVNLTSTRAYGEFEFWFSSIKVAAIVAFIGVGAWALLGGEHAPQGPLTNLFVHGGFMPQGGMAVVAGVTTVIFALCGAEIATIAAAESREPAQVVSRLTLTIVVRILVFYVLSIFVVVALVPWNVIQPGVSPFAVTLGQLGWKWAEGLMNFVVLTAVLSCLNSGVYVASRSLFVLAAHGDAPARWVALSPRRVPVTAILVSSVFGFLAVVASVVSPARVFAFLVNASGALMLVIYLLVALAQLRLRRRLDAEDPARLSLRMWGYPWLTWLVVGAIVAVLAAMLTRAGSRAELLASLVSVTVVLIAYGVRSRR